MKTIQKIITGLQPKDFQGANRFDDAELTEWHIISTDQPDHIGDVMVLGGMKLPASGKNIVLLNHDRDHSAGLPVGKVLKHEIVAAPDRKELWQLTQYSKHMPDAYKGLGEAIYNSRKEGYFSDSSIQFLGTIKEPMKPEDNGLPQWEWDGTRYKEWLLLEAGPVLIGMNQYTGDMKQAAPEVIKSLQKALGPGFEECKGCGFCTCGKEKSGGHPSTEDSGIGRSIKLIPKLTIKLIKREEK